VPPTAKEPKPIEVGATVIVAGVGVGVTADFGTLAAPVQPEMYMVAERRSTAAARLNAFLPAARSKAAYFALWRNPSFMFSFLITPVIVNYGTRRYYCPCGHI
jgi:hypothetical protein